ENEIFKAFFTTKKNGTGVGLSLVKNIVEKDFNGEINFKNNENQGTTFIIKFKKCDQSTS
ncbi:MAG: ATP-binding protein, partial [Candidatus Pacebacteria bacterium]|nr:ATP-binding protein [Candidatus Paceibacterota bacterium]